MDLNIYACRQLRDNETEIITVGNKDSNILFNCQSKLDKNTVREWFSTCRYPSTGLQDGHKVTEGFVPHVNKIYVNLIFPCVM